MKFGGGEKKWRKRRMSIERRKRKKENIFRRGKIKTKQACDRSRSMYILQKERIYFSQGGYGYLIECKCKTNLD
jgi:hypothetical protein